MIILFNGPPGSGKDHAADYYKQYGFKHLSFKYQLFKETIKYFNVDKTWFMERYDDRSLKEVPTWKLGNMSCREAMIYVSEENVIEHVGEDTQDIVSWVKNVIF